MSLNASFTVSVWFFCSHPPTSHFLEPDSKLYSFQAFWCIFNTATLVRTSRMCERCRTKSTNVTVHMSVILPHMYFSTSRRGWTAITGLERYWDLRLSGQFSFLLVSGTLPGASGLAGTQGTSTFASCAGLALGLLLLLLLKKQVNEVTVPLNL